jgi:putative Ca2+/H+ antiporter (TMEM165/GDT1 family)
MGDKTQILAFLLATRFRKPWAIFAGIFTATVLNHLLAAAFGSWVSSLIPAGYLKFILAAIFFAFAAWILIPDKEGENEKESRYGAYLTTVVAFFLAEMGDKTQLATVALAARYQSIELVTVGTTIGMMLTDGMAVFFGDIITKRISMNFIRILAAILFCAFGLGIIIGY